ncbi:MAG TPA: chemotaxis protein CheA [Sedimentibacter sp.]|jgi:two-component system chemotaxis sensor kinase CheA|nr:chemotaxis protein CheA [Sedimentibacter sp.]HQC69369.1 chemotaxis protein CheA [Sedimentibacter sp.]HQO95033.1 chemotaxis protein CheA [Sedimentibacter sp.]
MDNNLDSVLDMYLFETNSLLELLDNILLKAESNLSFDKECMDEIFRAMHTIKGSSAMMQFDSIMTISHKIEDLFYYIRENGIDQKYNEELVNLVFKITDFIKGEIVKVEEGLELEKNLDPLENEIKLFLNSIKKETKEEIYQIENLKSNIAITEENNQTKGCTYAIRIIFDDDVSMENLRAFIIVNQLRETGIEFEYKPENIENIPETSQEIIENGFFVYVNKEYLDTATEVISKALNVKNYTVFEYNEEVQNNKEDETIINQTRCSTDLNNSNLSANSKQCRQSLITVNLSKLDKLVDIVGELVIAESMVESDADIKKLNSESFKKSTRQVRKLTDELQDIVMSLRMVPISGTFNKMHRIVRDMGKELNKDVELVLNGEDTEIDKTIADCISDPIMHLVRNAMDHGIEPEEKRISKGKNKKGKITLSAFNTGGEIHITVEDDGRGFDSEKILEKAEAKGLLTKPASEYTQKEAFQFLMLPGFSTNDDITEYSGRGVGMDVVKSNVEKVGGTIVLESNEGLGSKITFKIPLTLTIVSGMQVVVGNSEFIIPIKSIHQSFKTKKNEIIHNPEQGEMILIREKCYRIIRIHEYFNINTDITNIEDGILIFVESGDNSACLFVDKIIGEQQVVVKPLPIILNKYNLKESGIYGCSILGDGSINLILDVGNLMESNRYGENN